MELHPVFPPLFGGAVIEYPLGLRQGGLATYVLPVAK
jgi:hypothetical protein